MTATALEAVIAALATLEAGLTGVVVAYSTMPEALGAMPAWLNYPYQGTLSGDAGTTRELHTVVAELVVARGDSMTAEAAARPYLALFPMALFRDPTIAGTASTVNEVRYRYGQFTFAGETLLGIRFEVDLKLRQTL
jgi:hypothetical protein